MQVYILCYAANMHLCVCVCLQVSDEHYGTLVDWGFVTILKAALLVILTLMDCSFQCYMQLQCYFQCYIYISQQPTVEIRL